MFNFSPAIRTNLDLVAAMFDTEGKYVGPDFGLHEPFNEALSFAMANSSSLPLRLIDRSSLISLRLHKVADEDVISTSEALVENMDALVLWRALPEEVQDQLIFLCEGMKELISDAIAEEALKEHPEPHINPLHVTEGLEEHLKAIPIAADLMGALLEVEPKIPKGKIATINSMLVMFTYALNNPALSKEIDGDKKTLTDITTLFVHACQGLLTAKPKAKK